MRKTLFTLVILFVSMAAHAQKWYGKVGFGFAIPQAAQTLDVTGSIYSGNATYNPANDSIASFSIKKASFSSGFKGVIGAGYHVNNHFALELYADLGISTTNYNAEQDNVKSPNGAYLANDKITQKSQFPIMLIPAMVFKTDKPKLNMYGRLGLVLPLKNQVKVDLTSNIISATFDNEEIAGTLKTRFNIGFTGAGGVSYLVAKGVNMWAEVSFMSLSLFAKEMKITSHTSTQSQPISTLLPGTVISYGFSGQAGATQQPTFSLPYSNMGINIGISFEIK
jgi:hypothetical protein